MDQVLMFASLLSPLVTAIVGLLKRTFPIKKRYISILSFFVGLTLGLLAYPITNLKTDSRVWAGGIAGLSATGLYEISKHRSYKPKRS